MDSKLKSMKHGVKSSSSSLVHITPLPDSPVILTDQYPCRFLTPPTANQGPGETFSILNPGKQLHDNLAVLLISIPPLSPLINSPGNTLLGLHGLSKSLDGSSDGKVLS